MENEEKEEGNAGGGRRGEKETEKITGTVRSGIDRIKSGGGGRYGYKTEDKVDEEYRGRTELENEDKISKRRNRRKKKMRVRQKMQKMEDVENKVEEERKRKRRASVVE